MSAPRREVGPYRSWPRCRFRPGQGSGNCGDAPLALEEERVLVTKDRDFSELVFARRLANPCIVRIVEMRAFEEVAAMRELIERHEDAMREGALIVRDRA